MKFIYWERKGNFKNIWSSCVDIWTIMTMSLVFRTSGN